MTQEYKDSLNILCNEYQKNNIVDPAIYEKYDVKRGLRNADGSGVMAGVTNICCVHGYIINEGEKVAIPGELIYRGYNINDLIKGKSLDNRFGFEETVYLLLFGELPNKEQLDLFTSVLAQSRNLPNGFFSDHILKIPSKNIMNKMASSVLSLYSYDKDPEDMSMLSEILRAIRIIARMPRIMVDAYQVKKSTFDGESLFMHHNNDNESIAESILSCLRDNREYTEEEARMLDLCLMVHAEHGGGNNSTFSCRVLTSSGTDAYSAYAAAIGSLKGPRHGGANIKVMEMLEYAKQGIKNWENEGEVADFITKILNKQAGDRSGLVYGMGHAVYTLSDPRTAIIKQNAMELARGKEIEGEFKLLDTIERVTPEVLASVKGETKKVCANVDMYSGLVYRMLSIPVDLFTPLFAVSRISGWCAHRMEELFMNKRIIRPAYKAVLKNREYKPLNER
ncbi:MAG: citrate synthase [Oscillospiraceae bacterium]